jgi:radical SAM protein with 4Fe4S-binding SPASM domain
MPTELIYDIIDQLAEHPRPFFFSPFKVNEPLLDKRLFDILRRVNSFIPHARVRVFTNGSALTENAIDQIDRLINIEHLWISLNETDPEKYEALMGLKFDRTASNLDFLHHRGLNHEIVVSRVSDGQDGAFREYVADRWPDFKCVVIKKDGWLGYTDPIGSIPDAGCGRWYELSIMATGKVSLCCMDGAGEYSIGDVTKDSLQTIYNAPHWRERRERMQSRLELHPCSTCTY